MPDLTSLFKNPPEKRYKGVKSTSLYQEMRDGTQIAVDVLLPADAAPEARLPTVMIMARYWRSMELRIPNPPNRAPIGPREPLADDLIARGFAVVIVDGRGSGASTGVSRYPWWKDELADYGEITAWVTQQPWSNGNIGAVGISYEGSTAQYLLASGVAGVKSAAPMEYEYDVYTDVALPGGVFNSAFIKQWSESNQRLDNSKPSSLFPFLARLMVKGVRPVDSDRATRSLLKQAIQEHQANTDVFAAMKNVVFRDDPFGSTGVTLDDYSVFSRQADIEASGGAMFVWGSWMDGTTADTVIRTFNTLKNPQIGVIGAWKHEMTAHGSPYLKKGVKPNPLQGQQWDAVAGFFERTLSAETPPTGKTLFYYTLGEETWKQTDHFPPQNATPQTWYFQPQRGLSVTPPSGDGADSYTVDFAATTGLSNRWHTQMARPVAYPDRAREDRRLLTYTSAPLTHDMEITGYPSVTLHVASTTSDCAFFVYLEDVDPSGVVRYITEGQLRGLHRQFSSEPPPYWSGMPNRTYKRADAAPLPLNESIEIVIGLQPTSALIRRGHSIRIAIAGADKDTFARIPESDIPTWRISHSAAAPSQLRLPVIPRA